LTILPNSPVVPALTQPINQEQDCARNRFGFLERRLQIHGEPRTAHVCGRNSLVDKDVGCGNFLKKQTTSDNWSLATASLTDVDFVQ